MNFKPNDPPFTVPRLIFQISKHVRVILLLEYPTKTFAVTCGHVFMGSATYIIRMWTPHLLLLKVLSE